MGGVERYYNAKGQVLLEYMSNATLTRYRYNRENFRLERSKTESCTKVYGVNKIGFVSTADAVQNIFYGYDKVGNVVSVENIVDNPDHSFDQPARYDSIYRLIEGGGLEDPNPGIELPYQANLPTGGQREYYTRIFT